MRFTFDRKQSTASFILNILFLFHFLNKFYALCTLAYRYYLFRAHCLYTRFRKFRLSFLKKLMSKIHFYKQWKGKETKKYDY